MSCHLGSSFSKFRSLSNAFGADRSHSAFSFALCFVFLILLKKRLTIKFRFSSVEVSAASAPQGLPLNREYRKQDFSGLHCRGQRHSALRFWRSIRDRPFRGHKEPSCSSASGTCARCHRQSDAGTCSRLRQGRGLEEFGEMIYKKEMKM